MKKNIYKFLFVFLNLFSIFSLKFVNGKFQVSRILLFKTFILLILQIIIFIHLNDPLNLVSAGLLKIKQTEFSNRMFKILSHAGVTQVCIFFIMQFRISKYLAELFSTFLKFYKFLIAENFDVNKITFKIFLRFCIIFFLLIQNTILHSRIHLKEQNLNSYLTLFLSTLTMFISLLTIFFTNASLLFLEFIIISFKKLFNDTLTNFYHDHQKINFLLTILNVIYELIKVFNKSVSKLINYCLATFFVAITVTVNSFVNPLINKLFLVFLK